MMYAPREVFLKLKFLRVVESANTGLVRIQTTMNCVAFISARTIKLLKNNAPFSSAHEAPNQREPCQEADDESRQGVTGKPHKILR